MNIQLKNIKTAGGDETLRFTASVYFDDRRIAIVSNGGTGGGHQYDFIGGTRQEFYAGIDRIVGTPLNLGDPLHLTISDFLQDIQKTIPSFSQKDLDADIIIDCAIELQKFQKQCKTQTLFRLEADRRCIVRSVNRAFTSELKSYLIDRYGTGIIIINEFFT